MIYVYARSATYDEESLRKQIVDCVNFVRAKELPGGVPIHTEVIPADVPPASRPALGKVLDRLRPGDCVVVSSADRVTRTAHTMLQFVNHLHGRGVTLYVVDMNGVFEPEPVTRLFHPLGLFTEDRCRKCGKTLGVGYEAMHVGLCEGCSAVGTESQ